MKPIHTFRYLTGLLYALVANLKAELFQRVSEYRRATHKQYWQAGGVGGGSIVQLGFLTEAQALKKMQNIKGDNEPIVYVDFERGFIAYGKMSEVE